MKAKDQRENLAPYKGRRSWRRKHKGENLSSSLSVIIFIGRGIIAAVIVFINITILISFTRSTLPHPAVIPT